MALELASLETRLDYRFKQILLLQQALTHSSYRSGAGKNATLINNERLEFLGDRVLNLVIAQLLFEQYKLEDQGVLSRRYYGMTRESTLATVARAVQLQDYLNIDPAASITLAQQDRPLADAMEAVIAAIYIDSGGLAACSHIIKRYWQAWLVQSEGDQRDAKTALQEWGLKRKFAPPHYHDEQVDGCDHQPIFRSTVAFRSAAAAPDTDSPIETRKSQTPAISLRSASAEGQSKKKAQMAAATQLLEQLKKEFGA